MKRMSIRLRTDEVRMVWTKVEMIIEWSGNSGKPFQYRIVRKRPR